VHPGVARLVGTAQSGEQKIMAAVLAAGPGALASHRSAAHLHGVPSMHPPPVDIIVPARPPSRHGPRGKSVAGLDGVFTHRPRDLARTAPHRIDGIPCTNILRTLVDLGAVAAPAVSGAVGHALTNDLASLAAIETALVAHAERGRHGVTALRRAIDDWALDAKPADSVLEPAMSRLISRYGLPPVEFHARVGGREVDFWVIGTPIVLECDGWRYHGKNRSQFERDRSDDAEFAAHGWIVLRFTYRKITTRPSEVARQIRQTIERWTERPVPEPVPDVA
jgi:very-short-patch-repair endonuclease